MTIDLQGKRALVTGASKGIGSAIAIALAKAGCSVAINYRSDEAGAKKTLAACNEESFIVKADVSNEDQVRAMSAKIEKRFGGLDIVVNNAGIFDEDDSTTNVEVFDRVYQANLRGAVVVTAATLGLMERGSIITISSIHGRLGHGAPRAAAYSALKAALENYTLNLAKELAPKIRVNAIAPGRVATPMWGDPDELEKRELGEVHLIGRMIEPEEIAEGAVFLARNEAVCGTILTIDGGMGLVVVNE